MCHHDTKSNLSRREFMGRMASLLASTAFIGVKAPLNIERTISFDFVHTGEGVRNLVYWRDGAYLPDSMSRISDVLKDHRTGERHPIDPRVIDILYDVQVLLETDRPAQVCSGYRSPKTNEYLRSTGGGGVSKYSYHMSGMACDFSIPGFDAKNIWNVLKSLGRGGAGIYSAGFVHADVGEVRWWTGN